MCWKVWGAANWNTVSMRVRLPRWIVLLVWVFLDHSYPVSISVFLFLHLDSMYGIVPGAFWAKVNELHCVHAFWQLILWRPCLENSFLRVFLGELGFLVKKPTYTLKNICFHFLVQSVFVQFFLPLFCQQNLRNVPNYFRKIHKTLCKVHRKISASTSFIYLNDNNSICLYGHCHGFQHFMMFFIFYLRNPM